MHFLGGVPYAVVNDGVYFIGWWNKLWTNGNNNANFQWKAYDNHIQNWPIVLKMVNGRATMLQRQPNVQVFTIWSAPLSANVQFAYGGTNTNDEWAIVDAGGGYWRITNRHSGKSAEVVGGGTADGTNVAQGTYTGATYQQFQIIAVP